MAAAQYSPKRTNQLLTVLIRNKKLSETKFSMIIKTAIIPGHDPKLTVIFIVKWNSDQHKQLQLHNLLTCVIHDFSAHWFSFLKINLTGQTLKSGWMLLKLPPTWEREAEDSSKHVKIRDQQHFEQEKKTFPCGLFGSACWGSVPTHHTEERRTQVCSTFLLQCYPNSKCFQREDKMSLRIQNKSRKLC